MSNNNSNIIAGLLSGAAIGLTLGILYAPDKGSETRKKIKEKANDAKDSVVNKATEARDMIVDRANQVKQRFSSNSPEIDDIDREINALIQDAGYTADEAISSLEKKLAELKKKNREIAMN